MTIYNNKNLLKTSVIIGLAILGSLSTQSDAFAAEQRKKDNEEYHRQQMQSAKVLDGVNTVTSGRKRTEFQDYTKLEKQVMDNFDQSMRPSQGNQNKSRK